MKNKGEIIFYHPESTLKMEVRIENETVWLTQAQIAELFGVKQPAISKHLKNIYDSGELNEDSTYSILEYMGNDGKQRYQTKFYNLMLYYLSVTVLIPRMQPNSAFGPIRSSIARSFPFN